MLVDYHTHSYRCGHAAGAMQDYIEEAIHRGLDEIGLTDHLFLYFQSPEDRSPRWAMPEEEFPRHFAEMVALRHGYRKRITVRVGVEADFVPGAENDLAAALDRYAFDYVLGGVHFLDEWMVDDIDQSARYRTGSVAEIYRRYYGTLLQAVESGMFDVIAHFDLPKKFGYFSEEDLTRELDDVLDAMADWGIAIEVSTAGLRKPVNEMYPSEAILKRASRRNIPIVLASDAHDPSEVACRFGDAAAMLARCGVQEIATFDQRELRRVAVGGYELAIPVS